MLPRNAESEKRNMIAGLRGIDTMESGGMPHVGHGLRLDPNVVAQRVGDDVVLVHLRTNRIFELNATGGRVWALLSAGAPPDSIVTTLLDEFDIDEAPLRAELAAFLETLRKSGLVTDDDTR